MFGLGRRLGDAKGKRHASGGELGVLAIRFIRSQGHDITIIQYLVMFNNSVLKLKQRTIHNP
jgi:hypothetical protein